jgi:hypothetical protein
MNNMNTELMKAAGNIAADAIEAYELLDEKLKAANVIIQRYASRDEQIELDIGGALAEAARIRAGRRPSLSEGERP